MKASKKWPARLLAAALAAAVLGGTALPARAEGADPGYEYTDPYVLTYEGSEAIGEEYQEYCKPYLYASPHMSTMGIRDLETGKMVSWYCSQQVYNMIDTTKIAQGGEGAYASLEVYCVDACINADGGSSYQRVNLEDSTYFDDDTAGRIRAVFMSSFPYIKDMSAITDQVNAWLAEQGGEYTAVSGLTAAEVVTATQYTIWLLANGEDVQARKPYSYTEEYTDEELADEVVYIRNEYMDCGEAARDTTANNIAMVQQYLAALEPMQPQKRVASDGQLTVDSFSKTGEADGTYTVTVNYTVTAQLGAEDELVLTAAYGDTKVNTALTAQNLTGTLTLTGVKAEENVLLEINGTQTGGDVYLFDATGDRSVSQSMVGYAAGSLPVHARAQVNCADHILQIYKTTEKEDGQIPLANIEFELYRVAAIDQLASGSVTLGQEPTQAELDTYKKAENLVTTLKTDAAGFASFNLTRAGEADGVFLVVEKPNSAVTEAIGPFYVAVPGTAADGTEPVNVVTVQPKNTVETGPDVKKDVTEIGNDHGTFDVDQLHTWIIRGGVPAGIGGAEKYVITDTLDWRLTYKGNLTLKVGLAAGKAGTETVTLAENTDYILVTGTAADDQGNPVDTLTVSLTTQGMKTVANAVSAGTGQSADYEVRVYFDAVIDADAGMGESIPNQAGLEYKNSAGMEYQDESDVPEVHTGGLNILKVDSADNAPLAGASFQIARDATAAELADDSVVKETLTVDGREHQVVFVDFHAAADLSGGKVSQVTTGTDGRAVIYGLAYGEYYVVETKAPGGYHLLSSPVVEEIDAVSHEEGQVMTIINSKFILPETGGMGTALFTAAGVVMIGLGAAFVLLTRRKKQA